MKNSFFDMKKWLPVQKIIWNLFCLFVYRILHQKIFQKNQSKGVPRDKKNKQDLLLSFPEICLTGTLLMHPIPSRDTTVQVLIESLTIFGI